VLGHRRDTIQSRIPGFGILGKSKVIRDGGLYDHLNRLINGEFSNQCPKDDENARRYRRTYESFYMAEIEARIAGQWLRLGETYPWNKSWRKEHNAAKAMAYEYYESFVRESKEFKNAESQATNHISNP